MTVVRFFHPRCPVHRRDLDFEDGVWFCPDAWCDYQQPDHGEHQDRP